MTAINPYKDFGLANVLVPGSNKGKIVYVDTAANGALDANNGLRVGEAKLTIHGALAICTDYMWDTIIVLNYTSSSEIAWPIAVDVDGVRIIAAPGGGDVPRYTGGAVIDSVGDTACIHMDANHIRIEGFDFRAGTSHAGIEFDVSGKSRHGIYRCTFTSGLHGVWCTTTGCPSVGLCIKDCFFIGALTSDGILYNADGPFARFEDNVFDAIGGIAIHISAAAAAGRILRNIIGLAADSAAKGIVISDTSTPRWLIADNQANFGASDMVNNPYLDQSIHFDNHWMRNYAGSAVIMPATA